MQTPRALRRPGPARGPQKRAERTRRAVLDATLRVIARRGIGATTFRDVAAEAGVSLGVVTYHFPNRRDLLTGAFALHLEQTDAQGLTMSEAVGPALGEKALSGEALVDAVVELLRTMVVDERDSFVASHELTLELVRDPELAQRVRGAIDTHRRLVEQMIERAGSPEPALDAEILSASFEGLALKWLAHPGDAAFEARLRQVVARLLGVLAPAS